MSAPVVSDSRGVSVIVPNYNGGRFLARCLDSLLAQTHTPLEILVVDGASTDNSLAVVETCRRRFAGLRCVSERDEGPADAINKGLRQTTGPFVTWLNADDALEPRALELAMAEFAGGEPLSLVYGSVLNVTEDGAILALNRGLKLPATDLGEFDFIPQAGAVFRRYEGLRLDASLEWGFDWALWIDLAARGPIRNIDHVVGRCIVTGQAGRKSDMIIPRRTLELARIARRHAPGLTFRVSLAYLTAMLGYACSPLGLVDPRYHGRIVRWAGRLNRLVCGRTGKGIML